MTANRPRWRRTPDAVRHRPGGVLRPGRRLSPMSPSGSALSSVHVAQFRRRGRGGTRNRSAPAVDRQGVIEGLDCSGSSVPEGATPVADVVARGRPRRGVGDRERAGAVGGACRRCLAPAGRECSPCRSASSTPTAVDGEETYPLVDHEVDLEPLVRDAVLLELPLAPLCRTDCQGLCPRCAAQNCNDVRRCACHGPSRLTPAWSRRLRCPARPGGTLNVPDPR